MKDKNCYVYVIAPVVDGWFKSPVKVGIAENPWNRLSSIQTGSPNELQVAQAFVFPARNIARDIERGFHRLYAEHCVRGEWFDLDVVTALKHLCNVITIGVRLNAPLDEDEIERALEVIGVTAVEANLARHGHSDAGESVH